MAKEKQLNDEVSSSAYEGEFKRFVDTEWMRQKIIGVLAEELEKVAFADKVKKYAAEEMDKRIFRSVQYWLVVILTSILTAGIGFVIAKFFGA